VRRSAAQQHLRAAVVHANQPPVLPPLIMSARVTPAGDAAGVAVTHPIHPPIEEETGVSTQDTAIGGRGRLRLPAVDQQAPVYPTGPPVLLDPLDGLPIYRMWRQPATTTRPTRR
jgi:hypothetical protein